MKISDQSKRRFFSLLTLLLYTSVSAASLENALRIEVTQYGLEQISSVIKNSFGEQIKGELNTEVAAEYGPLKVTDAVMGYSFKIDDVNISGEDDVLKAKISVSDARIHVHSFKIKARTVIGSTRFTCRDLVVKFGHGHNLESSSKLRIVVKEGQFLSATEDSSLDVDRKDYEVQGPRSCTGDVGVGQLVKLLVRSIADKSYPRIIKELKHRLASIGAKFGDELNKLAKKRIDLNYGMVGADNLRQSFAVAPEAIQISTEALFLQLGFTSSQLETQKRSVVSKLDGHGLKIDKSVAEQGLKSEDDSIIRESALRLTLNPDVLEYVLQPAVAGGRLNIDCTGTKHLALRELLQPHQAANIWPDLLRRRIDGPLGLSIKFTRAPRLVHDTTRGDQLHAEISDLDLRFKIPSRETFVPYFTMRSTLRAPLELHLDQSKLKLGISIPSAPELNLSGRFDVAEDDLSPAFFEADMAHALLRSSLEYLYQSGSVADFILPQWDIGERNLAIKSATIVDGNIMVELSL